VDEINDSNFNLYTMKASLFFSAKVTPEASYSFTQSAVTFEITLADPLR
jgi:hypothetical protein